MIVSTNIHWVLGMTAEEVKYLESCKTYTRKITVQTKYNGQQEITLFAEKAHDLYFRERLIEKEEDPDKGFKTGIPK